MKDNYALLSLYLWDVRAQLEAQLRSLANVQRLVERLTDAPVASLVAQRHKMLEELADIVTGSHRVREVAGEASVEVLKMTAQT